MYKKLKHNSLELLKFSDIIKEIFLKYSLKKLLTRNNESIIICNVIG